MTSIAAYAVALELAGDPLGEVKRQDRFLEFVGILVRGIGRRRHPEPLGERANGDVRLGAFAQCL
jgi:hypothetical protein